MVNAMKKYTCTNCGIEYMVRYSKSKFCSRSCSVQYNNKNTTFKEERKKKISDSLRKHWSSKERRIPRKECLYCKKEFMVKNKRIRYCSPSCAGKALADERKASSGYEQYREIFLTSSRKYWKDNPDKPFEFGAKSQLGKHGIPFNILALSKRTVQKILRRLDLSCSKCGWNEDVCDLHHIIPRKQNGSDEHSNLSYLCPNCHRLAGNGKMKKEDLVTFDQQVGDAWRDYYFG